MLLFFLSLSQGPRGARGARGPTGKPGPKVDDSVMDGQNIQETLKRIVVNSSQTNDDFEQYLIIGKIFECFGKDGLMMIVAAPYRAHPGMTVLQARLVRE